MACVYIFSRGVEDPRHFISFKMVDTLKIENIMRPNLDKHLVSDILITFNVDLVTYIFL